MIFRGGAHWEREGRKGGEGREGTGRGEGVPECPNPELASLAVAGREGRRPLFMAFSEPIS